MNEAAEIAVPPGVVMDILPVFVRGTMAVIAVALTTVKLIAAMPLNFTEVAPDKLVPMIVTFTPAGPEIGVKELIVGDGMNVNGIPDITVPPGVVMEIGPVVVLGTLAVMDVELTTLKLVAEMPLNFTELAPDKLVPEIVTITPIGPEAGENELIVGAGINLNDDVDVAIPPGVVTEIGPVVVKGTVATMDVELIIVKLVAGVPLNFTEVAPDKLVPEIVTLNPFGPELGENLEIIGAGINVNDVAEVAVPPGVVTVILPEAVLGMKAVMELALTTKKLVAAMPLNFTAVAPNKLVPLSVTITPNGAEAGENDVIVGAGMKVKGIAEIAVPPGEVMVIGPVVVKGA